MNVDRNNDPTLDLVDPSEEDLRQIAKSCGLTAEQAHTLGVTVRHVVQDTREFGVWRARHPARSDLVVRLKRIEKELRDLRWVLSARPDDVTALLPRDLENFLASAFKAETLGALLGQDLAQAPRPRREALALKNSGPLLASLVKTLHEPFARWVELDRGNKGGRPADGLRRFIVAELAKAAPEILGQAASVSQDGPFARLCAEVTAVLGLKTNGLEKLVPRVVKAQRDLEAKALARETG